MRPQTLTPQTIAHALGLPIEGLVEHASGEDEACVAYLLDRPLSVQPLICPVMCAGGMSDDARARVLTILRDFRAAVRGLDDVLDGAACEPDGRPSTWRRFGTERTVGCALYLWQRAIDAAPDETVREAMLRESACMLYAARLEEEVRAGAASDLRDARVLAAVELEIRDKEHAYWRLVMSLIQAHWDADSEILQAIRALFERLADVWQLTDDVRDFDADLDDHRLNAFMVELLSQSLEPCDEPIAWPRRLKRLRENAPRELALRLEREGDMLVEESSRIRAELDEIISLLNAPHEGTLSTPIHGPCGDPLVLRRDNA